MDECAECAQHRRTNVATYEICRHNSPIGCCLECKDAEIVALCVENERLRKALGFYGQHRLTCSLKQLPLGVLKKARVECSCGLNAALADGGKETT